MALREDDSFRSVGAPSASCHNERIIPNALADGGDTTNAVTVPVPASSGYPLPTSQ
jgi:hypothetical protein